MTEEQRGEAGAGPSGGEPGREQERGPEAFGAWMGVFAAFREALDETIDELRERGDAERAREAMRTGMRRAQSAMEEMRGRLDFVPRRDFDLLRAEVARLEERVSRLEGGEATKIPIEGE